MKNIRIKMRFFVSLALFALVLNGCADVLLERGDYSGGGNPASTIPEGFGEISVNLFQGVDRSVIPAAVQENLYLKYEFAGIEGGETGEFIEKVPVDGKFVLETGSYTLKLSAFADQQKEELVAWGTAEITIANQQESSVDITLNPIVTGEGTGRLRFTLGYPAGTVIEAFTLTQIVGTANPIDLKTAGSASGGGTVYDGTMQDIPVGYYLLQLALNGADGRTGRVAVVHIYQNLSAELTYTFTADDFKFYAVNSAADDGEGSLRQAITSAPAGQTIRITLETGSVIQLASALSINKSLIIEGGGVTLTRSESFPTNARLLNITGTGTMVSISRVHFKDGLASSSGAAISNAGSLTLEACIFSGNRTTTYSTYYGGGVIFTSSALTIRACTFYGNSSVGDGGVLGINNNARVTLIGNLFYGNTGSPWPVVYIYNNRGSVTPSYNVVDVVPGTVSGQAGWTAGIGDVYSGSLPTLSAKTFKPLFGTPSAANLPATLPAGYPAVDFYGNPIRGGGPAGAVSTVTDSNKYYLGISVNNSERGSVSFPDPDQDGLVTGNLTLTASAETGYPFAYWLENGKKVTANPYNFTIGAHTIIQAVFVRPVTVSNFTDAAGSATTAGTLRYALTNAEADDLISFTETADDTQIELTSALPAITKNVIIEGNGITLTRAASWTSITASSQLLSITNAAAVVTISRVHFRDGRASGNGAAVNNKGSLTLEACIFSGNLATGNSALGGAVYSDNELVIRASTFYNNSAESGSGGAVYFINVAGKSLTLTGNLFYGNTGFYPVVREPDGSVAINASYNVVDANFGRASGRSGWTRGEGDVYSNAMTLSPATFRVFYGTPAAGKLPGALPDDYPAVDFYGNPIGGGGAAGAVNTVTEAGQYYLTLSVNNSAAGSVSSSITPDASGMVDGGSVTITLAPIGNYSAAYLLENGERRSLTADHKYTFTIAAPTAIYAVFKRPVTVTNLNDAAGGPSDVTLRYALANAQDDDIISLSGVSPGSTTIALGSPLPAITKSVIIEGNGITLTRAASWTDVTATSQLLRITDSGAEVSISRVHFKDGIATDKGAAIYNDGRLTLDACIFSGNRTTGTSSMGGAIYQYGDELTIRACTFYGNAATYSGAAVDVRNIGKSLTMTGNLFYQNTALYWSLLYGAFSVANRVSSYNVADGDFGDSGTGLPEGEGNTKITVRTVSAKAFKVINGSGAETILPSTLPDGYPTTDFYGNTIGGGEAAGAVNVVTASGYHLNVLANYGERGSVTSVPAPDEDGIVVSGQQVTVTASANPGYSFAYWRKDGVRVTGITTNTYTFTLDASTVVQAVFSGTITVNTFTDTAGSATAVTLRYALTNAQDDDVINFSGVTPGVTTIALGSVLPDITKSLTINGNGITLTRAGTWPGSNYYDQFFRMTNTDEDVTISRVHFKDGRGSSNGAAIYSVGGLTVESCIFSGNQLTNVGGAICHTGTNMGSGDLTIRACTFYGNSAGAYGGAVYYLSTIGLTYTMTGNLFYQNSTTSSLGSYGTVVERAPNSPGPYINGSYNVVDVPFGTAGGQAGWTAGEGDVYSTDMLVFAGLFNIIPSGTAAVGNLPATLPAGYPTTDFYGNPIQAGGQAGAVQAVAEQGKYVLGISINNSEWGTAVSNPVPDGNSMVPANTSVSLTATPATAGSVVYSFAYWQKGDERITANPYNFNINAHIPSIQAVFTRVVSVTDFTDGPGSAASPTLRYALSTAGDGDTIRLTGVNAGVSTIPLSSVLPEITKSITIEGNGVVLTRTFTGGTNTQLLRVTGTGALVNISRVHFKDGQATSYGAAVYNTGMLILESCIFSGNATTAASAYGGAVYSSGNLTVRACTFYGNSTVSTNTNYGGGAVHFSGSGKTLTLTGNLFYGGGGANPVVKVYTGTAVPSYNVVDKDFGTGSTACGWAQGSGDYYSTDLLVFAGTFKIPSGTAAIGKLPGILPTGYPARDFYGQSISAGGQSGAVQEVVTTSGYILVLSVNNPAWGTAVSSPAPDGNGMISANTSVTVTATPATAGGVVYSFAYWQKGDERITTNPYTFNINAHIPSMQAVFTRVVEVSDLSDGAGSATSPTLRYALTNAVDGDTIRLTGVNAGVSTVSVSSVLPEITKSVTIEGNGVVLTRTFEGAYNTQLLRITGTTALVNISRVHFKDGRANDYGAGIYNNGTLTLESCIFSGNQTSTTGTSQAGAINNNSGDLTIRGCTFYGNSTGTWGGGAIYVQGGALTLTGNLFYGNTGGSDTRAYPVVNPSNRTVTGSYNVVDVALGASTGQAGWAAGTGDTTFTDLSISGVPIDTTSFAPVNNAGLKVVPSGLANFPATYFNGTARTFPGAPGAVAAAP